MERNISAAAARIQLFNDTVDENIECTLPPQDRTIGELVAEATRSIEILISIVGEMISDEKSSNEEKIGLAIHFEKLVTCEEKLQEDPYTSSEIFPYLVSLSMALKKVYEKTL